jgi:hypothetical protein
MADSLSRPFDEKIKNGKDYISRVYITLRENSEYHDLPINDYSEEQFRKKILSDNNFIEIVYNTINNKVEGFKRTKIKFRELINNQLTLKDVKNNEKAILIRKELKSINIEKNSNYGSILTFEEQVTLALKSTSIIFILFFIIRYLFYAIKWSIRTIK